jgi:hypothetical protein
MASLLRILGERGIPPFFENNRAAVSTPCSEPLETGICNAQALDFAPFCAASQSPAFSKHRGAAGFENLRLSEWGGGI